MKRRYFPTGLLAPLLALWPRRKQPDRAEQRLPLYSRYPDAVRSIRPDDVFAVMHEIGCDFRITWSRYYEGRPKLPGGRNAYILPLVDHPTRLVLYAFRDNMPLTGDTMGKCWNAKLGGKPEGLGCGPFAKEEYPHDIMVDAACWLMTTMTTEEGKKFDKLLNSRLKVHGLTVEI